MKHTILHANYRVSYSRDNSCLLMFLSAQVYVSAYMPSFIIRRMLNVLAMLPAKDLAADSKALAQT